MQMEALHEHIVLRKQAASVLIHILSLTRTLAHTHKIKKKDWHAQVNQDEKGDFLEIH